MNKIKFTVKYFNGKICIKANSKLCQLYAKVEYRDNLSRTIYKKTHLCREITLLILRLEEGIFFELFY